MLSFLSFSFLISALSLVVVGLLEHYRINDFKRYLASVSILSILLHPAVIAHLDRDSVAHAFIYQFPFALITGLGAGAVWYAGKKTLDYVMAFILSLTTLQFLGKAILAVELTTGNDSGSYVFSIYASISQTLGAVLSLLLGISIFGLIVFDELEKRLQDSHKDYLSGLLNRIGFISWYDRCPGIGADEKAYLAVCDLDYFKVVNDSYGHAAGDEVIRRVAKIIASHAYENAAARFGGEEFVYVLKAPNNEAAMAFVEELRSGIGSARIFLGSSEIAVTISIGVSEFLFSERLDTVLCRADEALYIAKASGRNCSAFVSSSLKNDQLEELA